MKSQDAVFVPSFVRIGSSHIARVDLIARVIAQGSILHVEEVDGRVSQVGMGSPEAAQEAMHKLDVHLHDLHS